MRNLSIFYTSRSTRSIVSFIGWAIVAGIVFSAAASAARPAKNPLPWQKALQDAGVKSVFVCGNRHIQPNRKSLEKNFLIGPEKTGYVLSDLFAKQSYYDILTQHNLEDAKRILESELSKVRIWKVKTNHQVESLGRPKQITLPFTATIKDCVEGARTTMGNDCSKLSIETRTSCCREKFVGPVIKWGDQPGIALDYSPDPSVSLQIEKKDLRFCNISTLVEI